MLSSSISRLSDSEADLEFKKRAKGLSFVMTHIMYQNDQSMEDKPFLPRSMIYSFVMIINSHRKHLHKRKDM